MTDADRFARILDERCSAFLKVNREQASTLFRHYELLCRWNQRLNLTSVIELELAAVRHYAESLFLASLMPRSAAKVLDIGSGAGFPGFPSAVVRADLDMILVESDQRKAAFLREVSDLARNVRVRCVRADALNEAVDAVIGRAIRPAEIVATAGRIAKWYGILLSRRDGEALAKKEVVELISLPWDCESVALIRNVPRGTPDQQ